MSQLAERTAGRLRSTGVPRVADHVWPAVERTAERESVLAALAAGRSVLVVGGAGVGKTHLVDGALAERLRRAGMPLELTAGRGSTPTPASAPVTLAGGSDDDWSALVGLGLGHRGLPVQRSAAHGACVVPVTDLAERPPVLLRIEDAHRLEPEAARAVALLVRQGAVQVVATLRTAGAGASPWLELWKDAAADRVDLGPLSPEHLAWLAEEALGGPLTGDTSRRVWRSTEGNPFYLREMLRAELAAGALVERHGGWVGLVGSAPGQRLLDVVRGDLARLPAPAREALELIALAEPVPVSALAGLVEDDVLALLAHEGLVATGRGVGGPLADHALAETARVSPPVLADAVRALVPLTRRRQLFAVLRDARVRAGGPAETPASLVRSVVWALECEAHQSGERLLTAMRHAVALGRPEVAVQIGREALLRPLGAPGRRVDVLLEQVEAWRLLGEDSLAARDLRGAEVLLTAGSTGADHDRRELRALELRADLLQLHADDADGALALIEAFGAGSSGDAGPVRRRTLEVSRLVRLGRAGRVAASLEPSLALLDGERLPSPQMLRLAHPTLVALGQAGRAEQAASLGERCLRAAASHEDGGAALVGQIATSLALVHLWAGEVADAARLLTLLRSRAPGRARHHGVDHTGQGLLAAAHGSWSEAAREHHLATAGLAVLDPAGLGAYAAAAASVASAALGDAPTARRLIEAAQRSPLRGSAAVESDLRLHLVDAGAWLRLSTVRAEALALAVWSGERGLHRTELEALHRAAVCASQGAAGDAPVVARMRTLAGRVEGPRARALLSHAEAVLASDGDLVASAVRELGRCGLWLPSAGPTATLTAREREIAGLAAGGLSSRAIAERLTLSVRTVDSHLSRVFTKLGVRSRQELRELREG